MQGTAWARILPEPPTKGTSKPVHRLVNTTTPGATTEFADLPD